MPHTQPGQASTESSPGNQRQAALYEQFARIGKAMSAPKRLEILDLLSQGEKSVEALAQQAGLSVANTSAQLKALAQVNLVACRRQGKQVFYRLADITVGSFWLALRRMGEGRLAEVREAAQHFQDPEEYSPYMVPTLLEQVAKGQVTLLDVRNEDEYQAGHLPGALFFPLKHLQQNLPNLPKDKPVVAYCRGPYCLMAPKAVQILRENGFNASLLREGVLEWQHHGGRLETENYAEGF